MMLNAAASDKYRHRKRSVILVLDPNDSDVFVKHLPDTSSSDVNRMLFLLALLKRSGYVSEDYRGVASALAMTTSLLYYGTFLHHYLFKKAGRHGGDNISAKWSRTKSGHWNYVVI